MKVKILKSLKIIDGGKSWSAVYEKSAMDAYEAGSQSGSDNGDNVFDLLAVKLDGESISTDSALINEDGWV